MPEFYFASADTLKLLETLATGFLIEFDEDDSPVLLMKFDSAILTHIIKGVPIALMINNPHLTAKNISLIIFDNLREPLWVDSNPTSDFDQNFPQFDRKAIKLIGKQAIRIVLYNDLTVPVYSVELPLQYEIPAWHNWMTKVYNDPIFSEPLSNKDSADGLWKYQQSFRLDLLNSDHSADEKFQVAYNQSKGENADKVKLEGYNFNNYLNFTDGKHGANQELSIKHILSNYFTIDEDLFISPKNIDGKEFTDFVVLLDDGYILIESKFVISTRSSNVNSALKKATFQLNKSDEAIRSNQLQLKNKELALALLKRRYNLKLCVHNDDIVLNQTKSGALVDGMSKQQLPMFISVMVLSNFLAALYIKNAAYFRDNLEANLVMAFTKYYTEGPSVLIFRNFRAFGHDDDFFRQRHDGI